MKFIYEKHNEINSMNVFLNIYKTFKINIRILYYSKLNYNYFVFMTCLR